MSAQGYVNEKIDLSSAKHDLKFLIDFESQLPLRFISLNDFEERLYRAESLEAPDFATVESIVECFRDFPGFEDIDEPFTLTRELMFDTIFLVKDESE